MGSVTGKGIETGFNYHFNFTKDYSLLVGLHGGFSERNFTLRVPKEDFNPQHDLDFKLTRNETFDIDMYLSAPFLLQKRWFVGKTDFLDLDAGFNIRFYPDDIYYTYVAYVQNPGGSVTELVEQDLELTNYFKPWMDYNLGGGYSHILHNHNIVRVGLLTNLSSTSIAKGDYVIKVQGQPTSTGTYKARFSFFGISFSYTLTNTNRAIRRFYEKEGRKALSRNKD